MILYLFNETFTLAFQFIIMHIYFFILKKLSNLCFHGSQIAFNK